MKISHKLTLSIFACVIVLAWTATRAQAASKDHFIWSSDDGSQEIQALVLIGVNDRGLAKMILFDLFNGERLILYETVDAETGIAKERLEHDSGSWWIESGFDMHGEFESLRAYFDHIFEINPPADGIEKHVTYFLKSENFSHEQTYDYTPRQGGKLEKRYRESVLTEERNMDFIRGIPSNIRKSLFYLSRFDREVKYQYQAFIDFIVYLLESAGFKSDLEQEEFVFQRVGYEWGLGTMVTPEELEFTSRFESIDNADPLAGFRPEELFPEE